ncbi:MAG: hypothetical protein AUK44_01630 [Porphyromonadaceae bacterium CG2_30_38_12]|nr:MAG: hypothetical protein AUK44_01630 [Porphyromonadaceae bacterium CG2_30_38_12]
MNVNVGSLDKLVRLALAIILIWLFYSDVLSGTLGIVALILALVLTITSLINFCPLYAAFRINTAKKKDKAA